LHPLAGKNADSFISSAVQLRTLNYRIRIVFVRHHHTPAVSVTIGLIIQWTTTQLRYHQQDTWWYVMVLAKMHQFSKFFTRRFLRNARLSLTQGMFLFLWYFVICKIYLHVLTRTLLSAERHNALKRIMSLRICSSGGLCVLMQLGIRFDQSVFSGRI